MSDLEKEVAELKRRVAELEKKAEPQEEKEFIPREWEKIDYTANMRMDADSAKAMAAVVPDVKRKPTADEIDGAWARSRISGPSGFGPTPEQAGKREAKREDETGKEGKCV